MTIKNSLREPMGPPSKPLQKLAANTIAVLNAVFRLEIQKKSSANQHPTRDFTDTVINGLAQHIDEIGRPLCPCNFYPDKTAELERSREWVCACDEMKIFKYRHCLLFVALDGNPIT